MVVGEGVEEEAYIPEYLREYEVFHLERRLRGLCCVKVMGQVFSNILKVA